jgi:hypothetical protein
MLCRHTSTHACLILFTIIGPISYLSASPSMYDPSMHATNCPPFSWTRSSFLQAKQMQKKLEISVAAHDDPCYTMPVFWSNCSENGFSLLLNALTFYYDPSSSSDFHIMRHHAGASIFYWGTRNCHLSLFELLSSFMSVGLSGLCFNNLLGHPVQPLDLQSIAHGSLRAAMLHMLYIHVPLPEMWSMFEELSVRFRLLGVGHATGHAVAYHSLGMLPSESFDSCQRPIQHYSMNIPRASLSRGEAACAFSNKLCRQCLDGLYMTYWQMRSRVQNYSDWRNPCADAADLHACLYRLYVWHGGPGHRTRPDPHTCISFLKVKLQQFRCIFFFSVSFFSSFEAEFRRRAADSHAWQRDQGPPLRRAADAWCALFLIDDARSEPFSTRNEWCRKGIAHIKPYSLASTAYNCKVSPGGSSYHFIREHTRQQNQCPLGD